MNMYQSYTKEATLDEVYQIEVARSERFEDVQDVRTDDITFSSYAKALQVVPKQQSLPLGGDAQINLQTSYNWYLTDDAVNDFVARWSGPPGGWMNQQDKCSLTNWYQILTQLQREHDPDELWLMRGLSQDENSPGILRAALSDQYQIFDNWQLYEALQIAREHDRSRSLDDVEFKRVWSGNRHKSMMIFPESVNPILSADMPGRRGQRDLRAGIMWWNSEIGHGSLGGGLSINCSVCTNGMIFFGDEIERFAGYHRGKKSLAEGLIKWIARMLGMAPKAIRAIQEAYVDKFDKIESCYSVIDNLPATTFTKADKKYLKETIDTQRNRQSREEITWGMLADTITESTYQYPNNPLKAQAIEVAAGQLISDRYADIFRTPVEELAYLEF